MRFHTLLALFFFLCPSLGFSAIDLRFTTSDGQNIAATFYPNKLSHQLLILAPGFAQNKDTIVMSGLCRAVQKTSNALCFDFRGTGQSSGTYVFGAKEFLDIESILRWAETKFKTVNLLGLSLGAYSAVRAAYEWPELISKLLLVSCPTSIEDIISTGGPFSDTYYFFTHPNSPELKTGADWIFRWGSLFDPKPNLKSIAPKIMVPAAFFSGAADHLVLNSLSREVYVAMAGSKSWDSMSDGDHAEAMYVQHPRQFVQWIETATAQSLDSSSPSK